MRYLMTLVFFAAPVSADLLLNYNGFFGRMKTLQQPGYSDITLAFALTETGSSTPCQFYRLRLVSPEHDIPLDIAANGEISLPYDETLKHSNALLEVLQADNVPPCQVEFRLRSRLRLAKELPLNQLQHFRRQFNTVLHDLAGISKYWLPEVNGVIAVFNQPPDVLPLSEAAANAIQCQGLRCTVWLDNTLPEDSRWQFSQRPAYLLPLMQRAN
jgi:hypothetical protein